MILESFFNRCCKWLKRVAVDLETRCLVNKYIFMFLYLYPHFYFLRKEFIVMPLLILFILFFLVPWLALILLIFFLFSLVLLIPLGFAGRSVLWLVLGPTQLFKLLFNRRVRQNHALEHGTIHLLEDRFGTANIEGMAFENGFTLKVSLDPMTVLEAARSALQRLQEGESGLAIHPRCGTTIVVINVISSLIFIVLLFATGHLGLVNVLLALLIANFIGPFASKLVQAGITTTSDVSDLEVTGVEIRNGTRTMGGLIFFSPGELFVATRFGHNDVVVEILD